MPNVDMSPEANIRGQGGGGKLFFSPAGSKGAPQGPSREIIVKLYT